MWARTPPREVAMWRPLARLVGGLVFVLVAIGIVFLTGMRRKSPPVIDAVRRFNRAFTNPRMMRSAGTPGAYASVIRHVGRTTGRPYETPVGVTPTNSGFVIALPYGTRPDWLKNVLVRGSAIIVDAGNTYQVDNPEIVATAAVAHHLPPRELRNLRLFRIDQCLRVRRVEPDEAPEPVTTPA
jgi:deazaflavin-dependent oxidoreductase (nitroreductase family)